MKNKEVDYISDCCGADVEEKGDIRSYDVCTACNRRCGVKIKKRKYKKSGNDNGK